MKYHAFISYSHVDTKWATRIQRALEAYRPPKAVRSKLPIEAPRRLFPLFRDGDELPTSPNLGDNIRNALADSRFLIVVCSPDAARSRWVDEEIRNFKQLGRADRILSLIVRGEPNATDKPGSDPDDECFPAALRYDLTSQGELTDHRVEPIAADVRPSRDSMRSAMLKLAAPMFGVGYDILKRRDQERRKRKLAFSSVAIVAAISVLGGLTWAARSAQSGRLVEDARREFAVAIRHIEGRNHLAAAASLARAMRLDPTSSAIRATGFALLQTALPSLTIPYDTGVTSVAFSPDGTVILVAAEDGTVRMWSAVHGTKSGPELRHRLRVTSARFTHEGSRVITASADSTAQQWDARSGQRIGSPLRHHAAVTSLDVSADGRYILTGSEDSTARLWDPATGALVRELGHGGAVRAVVFGNIYMSRSLADESRPVVTKIPVAFAVGDAGRQYWNLETGGHGFIGPVTRRCVTAAWTQEHQLLAGCDNRLVGEVRDFNLPSELDLGATVTSVRAGADRIVTTTTAGTRAWELSMLFEEQTPITTLLIGGRDAALTDDGQVIATASDSSVMVWNAVVGIALPLTISVYDYVRQLRFNADGTRIAAVSTLGDSARVWEVRTGTPVSGHWRDVKMIALSPNGATAITAARNLARIRRLSTGATIGQPMRHRMSVTAVDYAATGDRVLTASKDSTVQIWDARTGAPVGPPLRHRAAVTTAAFSRDGRRVATGSADGTARTWNARNGAEDGTALAHAGIVELVQFDATGDAVFTYVAGKIHQWDLGARLPRADMLDAPTTLYGSQSTAISSVGILAFTDDPSEYGSRSRLVDPSSGALVAPPLRQPFMAAAFTADGQRLATHGDGELRVWDTRTGSPADAEHLADLLEATAGYSIEADGVRRPVRRPHEILRRFREQATRVRNAPSGSFDEFLVRFFRTGQSVGRQRSDVDSHRKGLSRNARSRDRQPALVLPLVHHLAQQRLQHVFPRVVADMAPADRDLHGRVLVATK